MISEQPQGAVLRLGKVVKVHPSDHSVDLVMMDNGAKLANVQLLSPTASTRSGRVDLPEPDQDDEQNPWSLKMSGKQDLLAAVAMMAGTPICVGFLYPQVNELAMVEDSKNLAINRHASDFYTITTDEAIQTMCHPGGAYLSFGGEYYNLGHKDDETNTGTGNQTNASQKSEQTSAATRSSAAPENAAAAPKNIVNLPDRTHADWNKVAIFAAHFDDEMIFLEPFVTDQVGAIYTCMYRYDANHLALRAAIYPNLQARVQSIWTDADTGKYLDPSITGAFDSSNLDERDAFFLDGDRLKNRIDQIIDGLTGIEHIVTHNPWGEYCHAHHTWVFSFVYEACQRHKINLWVGDFYRVRPHEQQAPFTTAAQAQLYRLAYSYWSIGFNSTANAEARFLRYYQIMRAGTIPGSTADYWTWSNLINESVADSYGTVLPPRNNVYFQLSGVVPAGSGTGHDGEYYSLLDPAGVFGDRAIYTAARKIIRDAYRTLRANFPVTGPKFFNGNRSTALINRLLDEAGGYDNLMNLQLAADLRAGKVDYFTTERYENYQERKAELNPMGQYAPSAYSRYTHEIGEWLVSGDQKIKVAALIFANKTRVVYRHDKTVAGFTTMREFIAKLIVKLPDVRWVESAGSSSQSTTASGEYRLFQDNVMQPESTTEWHDLELGENGDVQLLSIEQTADLLDEPEPEPDPDPESKERNGGGFDKNWKIKRNVRPITVKIHSPDGFKKPKRSSDFSCSPENAVMASRWRKNESAGGQQEASGASVTVDAGGSVAAKASANITGDAGKEITLKAGGNIGLDAQGNISGNAGGNINLKGAAIFLN